jgi:AraC-like DNA-binding protein
MESETEEISFVNAGYNFPEYKSLKFNWSLNQHAFLYFQGPVIVNGKRENDGACILYPKNTIHDYVTLDGFVNSFVGFQAPEQLFQKLSVKTGRVVYPDNCGEINDVIRLMCVENSNRSLGSDEIMQGLILKLIVAFARGTQSESARAKLFDEREKMTVLRNQYLSDLENSQNLDKIISRSGFSRTQFYKLYSKFFNVTPTNDIIWARLEKSREMIRSNPDIKIHDVAKSCGFKEDSYFFRTFKKMYGYTPKEYAAARKLNMN